LVGLYNIDGMFSIKYENLIFKYYSDVLQALKGERAKNGYCSFD
jgi:hypothetical protein